jgi:hypothetical protein
LRDLSYEVQVYDPFHEAGEKQYQGEELEEEWWFVMLNFNFSQLEASRRGKKS